MCLYLQIVLNRIRDQFFSYRDRQSVEAQRKEEDEARKDTLLKLGYTVPPTNLIGKKRLPASSTMEATEKRQLQKREEPHIISLIERHAGQRRREQMKTSQSIDSVNVNKILQTAQSGRLTHGRGGGQYLVSCIWTLLTGSHRVYVLNLTHAHTEDL